MTILCAHSEKLWGELKIIAINVARAHQRSLMGCIWNTHELHPFIHEFCNIELGNGAEIKNQNETPRSFQFELSFTKT